MRRVSRACMFVLTLLMAATSTGAYGSAPHVQIDKKEVLFPDVRPQMINDRTMVPIRALFEEMGASVYWDENNKIAMADLSIGSEKVTYKIQINSPYIQIDYTNNGVIKTYIEKIDVPAQTIGDRTLLPLRASAEAFGFRVDWNEDMQLASMTKTGSLFTQNSSFGRYEVVGSVFSLDRRELDVFWLTNDTRVQNGVKPLIFNEKVSVIAREKAKDMIEKNYYGHVSPTYGTEEEMFKTFDVKALWVGENINRRWTTPEDAFNSWMKSPDHKENMLYDLYNQIGVGVYGDSDPRWVQEFAKM